MKKFMLGCLLVLIASVTGFAQGFYFDVGLGFGKATTVIDGQDMADVFISSSVNEVGVDFGLKLGYGPIANLPLYVVGEFSGNGHRFSDSYDYVQFNSYLVGPGLLFYPVPFIQLGTSVGYSFIATQTDLPVDFYDSEGGFAGNASVAIDIGKSNHGLLLGLKYFRAINTLEVSEVEQESSLLSVFVRYAYRHKVER